MAELKTQRSTKSVSAFLKSVENPQRREDAIAVCDMMAKITKKKPEMWGTAIVGFGTYHYKYASGREGDWFLVGFSPRKQNLTLYIMAGFSRYDELMAELGKYKTGKSCLYLNRLSDADPKVLKQL
ncbi:MAG TPA: DUF1801 domain-containing protein, partial [Candidatus Krumholzibacteria bacterium]